MIIQTAPEGAPRLAITMDEHTALAGQFARGFGNAHFEPVEPRDVMLYVISQHDKGWAEFDAAPKIDPRTGLPYNLVDTPAVDITRTSSASPDFHEKHHPYAALISSMHSWGLYNGRYGASDKVLINTIPPDKKHLAERMLESELERQTRLKAALALELTLEHALGEMLFVGRDGVDQHLVGGAVAAVVQAPAVHAGDERGVGVML